MDQFNLKQWLMENKAGAYSKVSLNEGLDAEKAFADDNENREDLSEVNPAALGMGQAVADREMQKQDDLNGDWVDNASMDVVAEGDKGSMAIDIKDWEVSILGKDHIVDAEVDIDYHTEGDEYVDHMMVSPGGVYIDSAVAKITKLGVEDGDTYRYVNDPAYIKQIQDLLNKDPKLNRKLEDEVGDSPDFQNFDPSDDYVEPDEMDETVGYAMITKPSDSGDELAEKLEYDYREDMIVMNDDTKDAILDNPELQKFIDEKSFTRNRAGHQVLWIDRMNLEEFNKLANFLKIEY